MSIAQGENADEPPTVLAGRAFLNAAFFAMLGLVLVNHYSTDGVRETLPNNQHVENEMPPPQTSSPEVVAGIVAKVPDETMEIAEAISDWHSTLGKQAIESFAGIVLEESKRNNYDWKLILAIIRTESQFNTKARSHRGAIGLMQVMPSTAKWLSPQLGLAYTGQDSLYDPEYNVRLGTHYLRMMHGRFGELDKAIVAYNRGPSGLERYLRQGRNFPPEYLVTVMGYFMELTSKAGERAS